MTTNREEYTPRLLPGRYAIIAIGVLAVSLAGAAVWYHAQLQRQAHQFWGNRVAELILRADKVNALRLALNESQDGKQEAESSAAHTAGEDMTFLVNGRSWRVAEMKDVTSAPGFSHVRRSLMNDRGFDWTAPQPAGPIDWQYALTFNDGPRTAMVLICLDPARVQLLEGPASASIEPVSGGFREFFAEQFPADEQEPDAPVLPPSDASDKP